MNRFLTVLNLLGVLALAGLCSVQWRVNRMANLEAARLEKTRLAQVATIAEQERTIRGQMADLDEFRARLTLAEQQQKETESKLLAMTAEKEKAVAQRDAATTERDRLKAALVQWEAAVAERDKALKEAGDEIQKMAQERNDATVKYNDLAEKYNTLVKDLDEARKKLASGR
jgi:chromosome segregation ATPase